MKLTKFTNVLVLGLTFTIADLGCRKHPNYPMTRIPGAATQNPQEPSPGGPIAPMPPAFPTPGPTGTDTGIPSNPPGGHDTWTKDAEVLKAHTIHFAFDSSVIRENDKANVAAVADYLKSHPEAAVLVEGNCDERGTAGYNQALGERRAQAVRTALVGLGIDPTRVDTISYGFDHPVDAGHDEAAWAKNRRADFVLLTKPGK